MVDKIISPRRDEILTRGGVGSVRTMEYLERTTDQVNASTEANEADPSTVNLSAGAISALNKIVKELQNTMEISHAAQVNALKKRIEQLESAPSINAQISALNKRLDELSSDTVSPFSKTKYNKLTIKKAFIDNATINELLKLPLTNDATSPTVQFGDGDSGIYEESDDVLAISLGGVKRFSFSITDFTMPTGAWDNTGINIDSGDTYKINGTTVLSNNTLGSGVTSSSLTNVGTLTALNISADLTRDGLSVVSSRQAAVPDASGGATIDAQARSAINNLLARIRAHGLITT